MFSSVFSPKPFSPLKRPSRIASASSSIEAMCRSLYRTIAFFGPSEEIEIICRTPDGIWARSSSSRSIAPVSKYALTFSAMDFPTLGMASRPFRSRVAMSVW